MMLLKVGYDAQFVLPVKDAVAIAEALQKAYAWKEEYVSGGSNTYHSYPFEGRIVMELISDDLFNMAKLAGKPEKR